MIRCLVLKDLKDIARTRLEATLICIFRTLAHPMQARVEQQDITGHDGKIHYKVFWSAKFSLKAEHQADMCCVAEIYNLRTG